MLKEVQEIFGERQELAEQSKPTGKFDYKLKSKVESLKTDTTGLEKLNYLYVEND